MALHSCRKEWGHSPSLDLQDPFREKVRGGRELSYATFGVKKAVRMGIYILAYIFKKDSHIAYCLNVSGQVSASFLETLLLFLANNLLKCTLDCYFPWIFCHPLLTTLPEWCCVAGCCALPVDSSSLSLLGWLSVFPQASLTCCFRLEQCRGQNNEINDGFKSNL